MKRNIFLDATALSHGACLRRLYLTTVGGYDTFEKTVQVVYGQAFHKFAQIFEDDTVVTIPEVRTGLAINSAYDIYRNSTFITKKNAQHLTIEHLGSSCLEYVRKKPSLNINAIKSPINGKPLTEVTFAIKVIEDDYCNVYIAGTIDRVVEYKPKCLVIGDFKTTAAKDTAKFLESKAMTTQLRLYHWALIKTAERYPDKPIAKLLREAHNLGTMIIGVFLDPNLATNFETSRIWFYKQWEIDEFDEMLRHQASLIAMMYKNNLIPQREGLINGSCTEEYGSVCPYFYCCLNGDEPEKFQDMLRTFKTKEYNPLKFNA